MILKRLITVIFITVFFIGKAQSVSGIVISRDNLPLQNVSVLKGSEEIAVTNSAGIFSLDSSKKLPVEITLQKENYASKTVIFTISRQVFVLLKNAVELLDKVEITSNKRKESGVLIPTSQVTAAQFNNYSPIDLVQAINQTPGVFIQSGAINTNRITIRGVGSRTLYGTNKIRAYYNGIPITNGVGETSIDIFNSEDLETIEIIKGPKATLFGTNLGGTVLISNKEGNENSVLASNKTTLGSYDLFKNSVSSSYKDQKFSLHFNYDYLETEGFRQNSDYNRNTYVLNSKYKINNSNEIGLLILQNNTFAQIASSISESNFNEDITQAAFTWGQAKGYEDSQQTLVGLNYKTQFSKTFENETSVYYSNNENYEPRPFNILTEKTNGYGARTVFNNNMQLFKRDAALNFGAEWYQDNYEWQTFENLYEDNNGQGSLQGNLISNNEEIRTNLNLFASGIVMLSNKLQAQLGLNINKTDYDYEDKFNPGSENTSAKRNFDLIAAPNLNLLYKFSANKNIYANISRGFNYPSLEETLTPSGIVNPDIGPEIGWNYEIGTSLNFPETNIRFQFAAYLLSISDLLVAQRVGDDQFVGKNAGKTHHRGVEIALDYRLAISSKLELVSYINTDFNFHKFIDFVDGETDFSGNDLTGVPDKKITAGVRFNHKAGFYLLSNFQHIGTQPLTDANSLESDSYSVKNLKGGYSQKISKAFLVELSGGINNVFDKKYASSVLINASSFGGNQPRYFYPGAPRNYYVNFGIKYQL